MTKSPVVVVPSWWNMKQVDGGVIITGARPGEVERFVELINAPPAPKPKSFWAKLFGGGQ